MLTSVFWQVPGELAPAGENKRRLPRALKAAVPRSPRPPEPRSLRGSDSAPSGAASAGGGTGNRGWSGPMEEPFPCAPPAPVPQRQRCHSRARPPCGGSAPSRARCRSAALRDGAAGGQGCPAPSIPRPTRVSCAAPCEPQPLRLRPAAPCPALPAARRGSAEDARGSRSIPEGCPVPGRGTAALRSARCLGPGLTAGQAPPLAALSS